MTRQDNTPKENPSQKFVLKHPEVVKATQWTMGLYSPLVKRTSSNSVSKCPRCGQIQLYHGQITTDGRWYHVCPDDYILEYEDGRIDVVKPEEFKAKYTSKPLEEK